MENQQHLEIGSGKCVTVSKNRQAMDTLEKNNFMRKKAHCKRESPMRVMKFQNIVQVKVQKDILIYLSSLKFRNLFHDRKQDKLETIAQLNTEDLKPGYVCKICLAASSDNPANWNEHIIIKSVLSCDNFHSQHTTMT